MKTWKAVATIVLALLLTAPLAVATGGAVDAANTPTTESSSGPCLYDPVITGDTIYCLDSGDCLVEIYWPDHICIG